MFSIDGATLKLKNESGQKTVIKNFVITYIIVTTNYIHKIIR